MTKIHIALDIIDGAYGGSHKFLEGVRGYFRQNEAYTDNAEDADVILFNSSQNHLQVIRDKNTLPHIPFVQRVDGHPNLYNEANDPRGEVINTMNGLVADASIFQSDWSRKMNRQFGLAKKEFETTIINAPRPDFFHKVEGKAPIGQRKLKIIMSSWSTNVNKGFDVYRWMDESLNFDEVEATFVGNSPIDFRNIRMFKPQPPEGVARLLKDHDVFVFASRLETCSNALVEALHCGLPVLALRDGGNPEIVGDGGLLFEKPDEIPELLESVRRNYDKYRTGIALPDLDEVGRRYLEFLEHVASQAKEGAYRPKGMEMLDRLKLIRQLGIWRLKGKINSMRTHLCG